jgi:hypothetical protein
MAAPRFRSLDAWRGGCALVVALFHFQATGFLHGNLLVERASRLVDFFFVLSGFVIAYAYAESLRAGGLVEFLRRRAARLWPLHLFVLAACIVMALAGRVVGLSVSGWTWDSLPANLTLTHAWHLTGRLTWNGPSWSISAEIAAYLLFALLAWRLAGRALAAACAAAMLLALGLILLAAPEGMGSTWDWGVARCLYGFMAGALAWMARDRLGWRPRGEIAACAAALLAVAFLPAGIDAAIVPVFAWTVLVFADDAGPLSRLLHRPLPQLLGRLSYSIYMVHYVVGIALMALLTLLTPLVREVDGTSTLVAPWWLTQPVTVLYLAAVILVSAVTWRFVEQPGRLLLGGARGKALPAAW